MSNKKFNNEKSRYKNTGQSGLYYETDMGRIIDDPISDRIFTKIVDWILRICIGIDVAVFLLRGNDFHIISSSMVILGIIIWTVCNIIHGRIKIMATMRNNEENIIQRAKNERNFFVIGRIITLFLSISSAILSFFAI